MYVSQQLPRTVKGFLAFAPADSMASWRAPVHVLSRQFRQARHLQPREPPTGRQARSSANLFDSLPTDVHQCLCELLSVVTEGFRTASAPQSGRPPRGPATANPGVANSATANPTTANALVKSATIDFGRIFQDMGHKYHSHMSPQLECFGIARSKLSY